VGEPLMNIMNFMKHFRGGMGYAEKKHVFFSVGSALGLFSCSFSFITFINLAMRSKTRKFVRQVTIINTYLMNIMKVYEEGVFMENFCKRGLDCAVLVKLCEVPYFINLHKRTS
jgi:hypothetical protein